MNDIEEALDELELKLKKLKIEYDQYFIGSLKREPLVTKGDVQRRIQEFLASPIRNARYKFRFNGLVARYQSYRQLWGRAIREIEAGTYKPHQFRERTQQSDEKEDGPSGKGNRGASGEPSSGANVDKLYNALVDAKRQAGEEIGSLTKERLARMVSKQLADVRRKHPSAKVRFQVVRDGKGARLKARVTKP
jgi:hypothetical protein